MFRVAGRRPGHARPERPAVKGNCRRRARPAAGIVQVKGEGVSRETDRDRSLERMLKAALPGRMTPPSTDCVDAEVLAAWADGTLPSARMGDVERHLADCGRCQAMLAAFARTEPPLSAPRPVWERLSMRWLVPIAVTAAAGAL